MNSELQTLELPPPSDLNASPGDLNTEHSCPAPWFIPNPPRSRPRIPLPRVAAEVTRRILNSPQSKIKNRQPVRWPAVRPISQRSKLKIKIRNSSGHVLVPNFAPESPARQM